MPQVMSIDVVKELIKSCSVGHRRFIRESKVAERYYENKNDILYGVRKNRDNDPLRNADNRIPRNFHGLLVNQKAAYMFSAPPLFDVGNKTVNKQIADMLGDRYAKVCKDLCIKASNCRVAWLHYWKDDGDQWKYGTIDPKQIIPVYSADLDRQLEAVLRNYKTRDAVDGKVIYVWEYWTAEKCHVYRKKGSSISESGLEAYNIYGMADSPDGGVQMTNEFEHGFGEVPFIPFYNNNIPTDDLVNVKPLIDAYDKVFSGFLNDLEDIQEIIFILTNYGGEDLKTFVNELKQYKAIKVETDGTGGGGGVEALTISIPIEAREKFLEITRKAIFEQGQGVDPDPQKFGNTSGEALMEVSI
ncbi:MAG: phage portal protein [Clostridia bacterium]|nr:phage portal protein [Clostridia bacterium]